MAFDPNILSRPLDGDDPCGPDLEAAGDAEFLAFLATAEGQMPASFFSFDATAFNHAAILGDAEALLSRSRDLRVLVLAAKAAILGKDLSAFVGAVDTIRRLLETQWDHVKPGADETGDMSFRIAPLYNLDDAASLVFPLQFTPLVQAPRLGAATYRLHLLATGAVRPRDGESADGPGLEKILSECALDDLVAARDLVATLQGAVAGIERALVANAGYEAQLGLERLPPVIEGMATFLEAAVVRRDPSRASAAGEPEAGAEPLPDEEGGSTAETWADTAPAGSSGPIADHADAAAALDAAIAYYRAREPSSPAIPLLAQARASVGKSLFEVIEMLVPLHAAAARINVGAEPAFIIPLAGRADGAQSSANGATPARPEAASRREATALLDQVSQYFRQSEPSSPVPLLIDRARALGTRDFLSLLKDVLPEEVLKTMKVGG